ncbi:sel1 repeat family protein [Hyphomicrobium sp. MC8b]|uniref:sel1 repeat family protein n=1 Tax=Hyphomicrobium sp. MC8b TaxID=300273 RepID=UPI00391DB368
MSKSEMGAERREGRDPHESGDDSRDELKSILDTIAAQLQDADRRHTAALSEMQDRISGMGREADLLRMRIPDQFAPAFEQIEAGIGELAHRLVDVDRSAARGAARTRQHRAAARSGHADLNNPWDRDDAEALASVYEASAYPPSAASARDADEATGGTSNIDEAWLESRFAEIARGIEYSLAHVKPESKFSDFDQRFDQFERQFAKVFAGVATHDDLATVQQIEAHMEEIVNRLEKTNDQLDRLNTIEAQLANVSQTLAEMQAANAKSADIGAVARAVAEETAQRFASRPPDERNVAADELRPLIEQLMTENRQGGEQTAMLLDTMQQAMVRLLDRVEAIDFPPQQPPPRIFEADHAANYGARTEMFGSDALRDDDFGAQPFAFDEDDSHGAFPDAVSPPPLSAVSETGMSPEEMALRSEKMRQEFIADARRAKMRLSAEGDDIDDSVAPSLSATRMAYASGSAPAGSRPIRPSSALAKNTSGPTAPSPRLMIIAGFVLLALAGLWYAFGFESKPQSAAVQEAAPATTTQSKTVQPGNATDSAKASGAPSASEPSSGSQAPSAPAGEPNAQGGVNGPRSDLSPHDGGAPATTASIDPDSTPRTTLPMTGVAVDLDHPVTEAELIQARRHQAMANISGELGSAAARPGESAVVPASMIPTEAETEGIAPPAQNTSAPVGGQKSSRLDMPPAMIGPLSFRLAAANGDSSAQFEVGARFAEGEGVPQNFAEAAKWYQRSAEQGFALAQYRLGTLYERGLGLKADRKQASTWYLRAAEQGNIKAMHNLAVLSANQSDRAPDYTTAAQWFEEAAKRGLPDSQFNLAVLYENGLGVTRDLRTAFMWLSLAAQGGDADAVRRRDILRGKLTAQDITVARKMIDAWRMTPTDRAINDAHVAGDLWKQNPRNGLNG